MTKDDSTKDLRCTSEDLRRIREQEEWSAFLREQRRERLRDMGLVLLAVALMLVLVALLCWLISLGRGL